uniref:Uncharacterized protein n=1 Tax=Romanomermis culicivorax TaxID=13658 RepID=A0A915K767_ROMCU
MPAYARLLQHCLFIYLVLYIGAGYGKLGRAMGPGVRLLQTSIRRKTILGILRVTFLPEDLDFPWESTRSRCEAPLIETKVVENPLLLELRSGFYQEALRRAILDFSADIRYLRDLTRSSFVYVQTKTFPCKKR